MNSHVDTPPGRTEYPTSRPIANGRDAIAVLMRWKMTFHLAVRMREPISERAMGAVRNPEECSIDRWLISTGNSRVLHAPEYKALIARHEEFHSEMLLVANLINHGRFDEAERSIASGSRFEEASQAVAGAITNLDRIIFASCR